MSELILLAGFMIASYAIVANDSIQTLGTFFASNQHRPWWVVWLFVVGVMWLVLLYGWTIAEGGISYGRLEKIPEVVEAHWGLLIAPLILLALTRFGIPVSTTFLVLGVFTEKALPKMVLKSLSGYVVAFVVALIVYRFVLLAFERWSKRTDSVGPGWIVAQWVSTAFLWSQWLIQDLANMFVYLPRDLPAQHFLAAGVMMTVLYAFLCRSAGGKIQTIVKEKVNAFRIPSATVVDFLFGIILLVFKEWSNVPMSTTWVFLGLLAGRELILGSLIQGNSPSVSAKMAGRDLGKAAVGIAVSVAVVLGVKLIWG